VTEAEQQDLAYERAVLEAWRDPALRAIVVRGFLHEDVFEALRAFAASEDWARIRRLLHAAGVRPPARVLDLGGGRGLVAAALAQEGYEAVLCEPNPSEVCGAGAAARLRARLAAPFTIATGAVGALEVEGFDAVVCRAVLHHVQPLDEVLRDTLSLLVPGGVFIASDEPTVQRAGDLALARARHPFAGFGVEEDAHPVAHYLQALVAAGFAGARARFPVAFGDYRRYVRPLPRLLALPFYARYRLRARLRPRPGQVVSLVARRPAQGATPVTHETVGDRTCAPRARF